MQLAVQPGVHKLVNASNCCSLLLDGVQSAQPGAHLQRLVH
jgi:hypothetical protein